MPSWKSQLTQRKPLDVLLQEAGERSRLKRVLGPIGLTSLGIGSIIGTGIFVLIGEVVHDKTGPAVIASFIVAALACVFAGLCYAEFASMVPVAGSAYTYAYATLGELMAWIIGWDLILEYAVSAATVAVSWTEYCNKLLHVLIGWQFPSTISEAPFKYDPSTGAHGTTGALINLLAIAITAAITLLLIRGIRESARVNTVMVLIKVSVLLFVIAVGAFYVDPANWRPFAPFGWTGVSFFGHTVTGQSDAGGKPLGMIAGAAIIFFSYIGFDSVSTQAEEARNPKRDVPIGIIGSLLITTVLYISVGAVLTGMVRYDQLDVKAPVSNAFQKTGLVWAEGLIAVGALTGITSVLLVSILGQTRILMAMARDGLLPRNLFGAVHPTFHTPWRATIVTGIFVALLAGFLPLGILAELVSIGTLFAFTVVCVAVLIMRRTHPDAHRPFKAPFVPHVPLAGIAICLLLMFSLPAENWYRLIGWLALGLVLYFLYGRKHSILSKHPEAALTPSGIAHDIPLDEPQPPPRQG
jgi:APA family basic amino acid/polyamine antiporter